MKSELPKLVDREERFRFGKSCRERVHRVDQRVWKARTSTHDAVQSLLEAAHGRLTELLPIKWARMAASPFGFFRGAVPLMAADLAATPVTGLRVQICGDAHVRNFGAFAAPDGQIIFDINDFDETIHGPWEWDVKRLTTSLVLAGREAQESDSHCREAVETFGKNYRKTLAACSELTVLELARYQVRRHADAVPVTSVLRKAERATPRHNLEKLTEESRGKCRFKEQKPLLTRVSEATADAVLRSLVEYKATLQADRRYFFEMYSPEDVAFKVVGTGSVGTRDYVVLLTGNGPEDGLFLQVKEEPPSAYAALAAPASAHQGERVVRGQRIMQSQSDILLGWTTIEGRDFLVRQLSDHKASIETGDLKRSGLLQYAEVCGEILGKAHARSGDPCVLTGYCGSGDKLDKAIADFAIAYADQTEEDHRAFLSAIQQGKIKAAAGAASIT
jgi:uncharacterized protein (DUF2252 family)